MFALTGLALVGHAPAARAQPETGESLEYSVKASYLLNFAVYVSWPAEAFASPESPIVIGILGEDPFGRVLDETAARRRGVDQRKVEIRRWRDPAEVADVHLLFISRAERARLPVVLPPFRNRPILTVGECDDFLKNGGGINLVVAEDRVLFEVNLEATNAAGLKVSSKMLSLAKAVVRRKPRSEP